MKNDGGPAYPFEGKIMNQPYDPGSTNVVPPFAYFPSSPGMTLRDWFAGQALRSLFRFNRYRELITDPAQAANNAYAFADAMLAERSKP